MLTITLPYPAPELNPNARVHHFAHARAKKAAKHYAWGVTKAAMGPLGIRFGAWQGPFEVTIVGHPATNRRRDKDNLLASCKAHLDGIALALGVDDSLFDPMPLFGTNRDPGEVEITIVPATALVELRGTIR